MTIDTERLLTVSQLARLANCSEDTIWRHVRKGALDIVRIGPARRIRIRWSVAQIYIGVATDGIPLSTP